MAQGSLKPIIRRSLNVITFEGPYDAGWVGAIKSVIPHRDRVMTPARVWEIDPRYYGALLYITKHYHGNSILDSTGGVSEPQISTWREKFDAYVAIEESLYKGSASRNKFNDHWDHFGYGANKKEEPSRKKAQAFDPYAMLFLTDSAPPEVIKAAFRALAAKYHPDNKLTGDTERMKLINAAHDILKKQGKVS